MCLSTSYIDKLNIHMLMCMCMLNKRAQILFEKKEWKAVTALAKKRKTSASAIIRGIIKDINLQEEKEIRVHKAIENIRKIRPRPVKGKIEYKELINYGRKY